MDTLKHHEVSERAACKSVGLGRSTYQYESRRRVSETEQLRVVELSRKHERYGYRRITAMLRGQGEPDYVHRAGPSVGEWLR